MLGYAPHPSPATTPPLDSDAPWSDRSAGYADGSRAGVGAVKSSTVFLVNDSPAATTKPASMLDRHDSLPVAVARRAVTRFDNPNGITNPPAQSGRGYSLGLAAGARLANYQSGAVNEGYVPRSYRPAAVTLDGNPVDNG